MEHGNRPIFSTKLGKIVYILADFGNRNIIKHGFFLFWQMRNGYLKYLERRSEIIPLRSLPIDSYDTYFCKLCPNLITLVALKRIKISEQKKSISINQCSKHVFFSKINIFECFAVYVFGKPRKFLGRTKIEETFIYKNSSKLIIQDFFKIYKN